MGDAEIARHSLRFFKTGPGQYGAGDRFLGIRVPALRVIAKKYQAISLDDAAKLLESEYHEERLTALLILVRRYQKPIDAKEREAIYRLYLDNMQWINNWDLVDCSAEPIVGAYLRERDKRPLYRLAGSASLWERRIAMMATFHYIKQREFDDALRIAEILLGDREDLIHKAVGWMLREIGKRDIETEERFLKRHCRQMPRTMLRYAIEKFPGARSGRRIFERGRFVNRNPTTFFFLAAVILLAAIGIALWHFTRIHPGWIYLIAVSVITFLFYGHDKYQAKQNGTRIPNLCFICWPWRAERSGRLLGQILFHHKTKKWQFRLVFILIVIVQAGLIVWWVTKH